MRTLRRWLVRAAGLFAGERREAELDEEIRSHLEMHAADNMRSGMPPERARREALLKLGGVEALKEEYRARSTVPFVEHLWRDLRFAARQLRKSPAFTGTAVLVLALGMCASVGIFAFVEAALIRPVPYPDPDRLVLVTERSQEFVRANLSYLDYRDWKRQNTVLGALEVFRGGGFLMAGVGGTEPVRAGLVSGGFFDTLGVQPLLGRLFVAGEEARGGAATLILSHRLWRQRFGGDARVLGRALKLSGEAYTIVGVLPADFRFAPLGAAELWSLIPVSNSCEKRRSCHSLDGVARLKPGESAATAQASLGAIAARLEKQYPESNRGRGATVIPFGEAVAGYLRPILTALMGGAVLLLAIASVNVASLVLARAEARRREMAVRSALGASRARLYGQFAAEGAALVAAAGWLGLASAGGAIEGLKRLIPADMLAGMPFFAVLRPNARVLACAGAVAALAFAVLTLAPALHLAGARMRDGLAEAGRGTSGNAWRRLGARLVVAELAIAMVLLTGAGLLFRSMHRLLQVNLGFRPDHLATILVAGSDIPAGKIEPAASLARQIVRGIEGLPGVESAAVSSQAPVTFNGNTDWIRVVGRPYDGRHIEVNERDVGAAYFRTIGARLARGRYFTEADESGKPRVVIINETLAKRHFAGEDPIGRQIGDTSLTPQSICTIVGVVEDIRDGALDAEIWPAEYHPFSQDPNPSFVLLARTSLPAEALLPALGRTIHALRPDVGASGEATMESLISNSMTAYLHRSAAWLAGAFAATALLLGIVGLYGAVAYSVSRRSREMGLRVALGAERGSLYRMILKETGLLVAAAIGLGAPCAVAAAALARKLLFGVSAWDAPTLAAVAATLALAAAAASLAPARRAASVDPAEALRAE